jgi:hypothetical protein
MTTRRTVLLSLAGLPLAPACVAPPGDDDDSAAPEPTPEEPVEVPFEPGGEVDWILFPSGIQVSDVAPDSALIALIADEPEVVLHVGEHRGGEAWQRFTSDPLPVVEGRVSAELTDLQPDAEYEVYASTPDGTLRCASARFRAALAPEDSRPLLLAATSCLGGSGAPWESMTHAADRAPDACLLLGDTVYADGAESIEEYRAFWEEALATAGLLAMSQVTSFVATWDDHEVDNNWSWDEHGALVPAALQAFREALPQRPGPQADRVYRSLRWGTAVELFALDCRADRIDGRYVGAQQMQWLKEGLQNSPARFKVLLNSVPIIDFSGWIGGISADDRWQGYPEDRTELLAFLDDEAIEGVLFVSGDMHFGSVCRVSPDGEPGSGHWEVMAGPGGSFINPMAYVPPNTGQYDAVVAEWNTTLLAFDPDSGTVRVTFLDDAGGTIEERLLQL